MARRAKGEGSIYKDKQGYWNAQIITGYKDGKPQYKKFRSKKQGVVVEKMNAYKVSIGNVPTEVMDNINLSTLLSIYTDMKKGSIRQVSYDSLLVTQNLIILRIGKYYVPDLTPEIIQQYLINPMCETHAYSTIHKAYVLLNECLEFAVMKDYISKNPCRQVKMPSKENFESKEIRILSDDEIAIFKATATATKKTIAIPQYQYGLIITLIIYTGLRVGELCALRWGDVDFENRKLTISKSIGVVRVNGKRMLIVQNTTKSGKTRYVPLNNSAIDILRRQHDLVGGDKESFVVNGSTTVVDKTVVATSYGKICERAGIEKHSGIHSLRHTFASLALKRGVDIKVISDILGHASVNFTYNTYVHIIEEQKINAVDSLNNI